jgi:hypothetical protein
VTLDFKDRAQAESRLGSARVIALLAFLRRAGTKEQAGEKRGLPRHHSCVPKLCHKYIHFAV